MNLETKRNAMMNGKGAKMINNILPDNLTWKPGYFGGSGGIYGPDRISKEMYCEEYIEVDSSKSYVALIYTALHINPYNWIGICTYDENEVFQNRLAFGNSDFAGIRFTFNQPKIRVSFRTYGDAQIVMCTEEDYMNFMTQEGIQVGE